MINQWWTKLHTPPPPQTHTFWEAFHEKGERGKKKKGEGLIIVKRVKGKKKDEERKRKAEKEARGT